MTKKISTSDVVHLCIKQLLNDYIKDPLMYLREANLQAQLQKLISEKLLEFSQLTCKARVVPKNPKNTCSSEPRGILSRVQQEMKIGSADRGVSDIVVFRPASDDDPVTLKREKNGIFDVVAHLEIEDIDAVMEIKAACSADSMQRHLFRLDIIKLLSLSNERPTMPLDLHFILVDKSMGVAGFSDLATRYSISNWWTGEPTWVTFKKKGHSHKIQSPQLDLFFEPPEGKPFVHVWGIEEHPKDGVRVVLRYCTMSKKTVDQ